MYTLIIFALVVKEQHHKSEFMQPMPRTYEVLKRVDNYRLRRDGALVRLDEIGLAELVLADDDAIARERVVRQAARSSQNIPKKGVSFSNQNRRTIT